MSFDRNKVLLDYYEMIYGPDNNTQKIFYEIKEENNSFKIIYKPNENKNEKMEMLMKFYLVYFFRFEDEKEYSGDLIKLLDRYFIKHNKNKCKLIYKNKKYELKDYFEDIENKGKDKDKIKLKIYGINNISDMSRMFYGCYHLSSFSDCQNQQNIDDLNDNFSEDNSYASLKKK